MGDAGAQPVLKPQTIYTFDQVIRERASDDDQSPLIAYPKSKLGVADYEVFTGKQLDRLVDGAAKALLEAGLRSLVRCPPLSLPHFFYDLRSGERSYVDKMDNRMGMKMKSLVSTGFRILTTSSRSSG
jgi:hypothetical protein